MSVQIPISLDELWPLLRDPDTRVMAGGTDLLVKRRAGLMSGPIRCLERIPELRGIISDENGLRIGAATTLTEILESAAVTAHWPVLTQAVRVLGSPLIRHQATLGGNIVTASPAGDTLPALHVLEAAVELASKDGVRTMPVAEFITGPGQTRLEHGEILAAVRIPRPEPGTIQHFEKVGKRHALAISVASLAAMLRLDRGRIQTIRLALGSLGPTVLRCDAAEKWLAGRKLDADTLLQAADLVRASVHPIADVRATAEYRRQVAGNLLLRLEIYS